MNIQPLAVQHDYVRTELLSRTGGPDAIRAKLPTAAVDDRDVVSGGPNRDLIDLRLADSCAHPGRNVTGTGSGSEVMRSSSISLCEPSRISLLWPMSATPTPPGTLEQMARSQAAALQKD